MVTAQGSGLIEKRRLTQAFKMTSLGLTFCRTPDLLSLNSRIC